MMHVQNSRNDLKFKDFFFADTYMKFSGRSKPNIPELYLDSKVPKIKKKWWFDNANHVINVWYSKFLSFL